MSYLAKYTQRTRAGERDIIYVCCGMHTRAHVLMRTYDYVFVWLHTYRVRAHTYAYGLVRKFCNANFAGGDRTMMMKDLGAFDLEGFKKLLVLSKFQLRISFGGHKNAEKTIEKTGNNSHSGGPSTFRMAAFGLRIWETAFEMIPNI